MNNEPLEGMIVAGDGRHAVMVDPKNGHYGWVFVKHPDGMWVSLRKATGAEFKAALRQNDFHLSFISGPYVSADCAVPPKEEAVSPKMTAADFDSVLANHKRLVRELDVLLNGEAGAAEQASLCDIVAQVRMGLKAPGTGPLQLLALADGYRASDFLPRVNCSGEKLESDEVEPVPIVNNIKAPSDLAVGDYVFASRWSDCSPGDPWHVGHVSEVGLGYVVVGEVSQRRWGNAMRITEEQGRRIVAEYPPMEGGPSLPYKEIARVFGVPVPAKAS